jgi:nucleoid-associated protein YgaU
MLLAMLVSAVSSVAVAEPAGEVAFVPVELGSVPAPTSVVVQPGDHLWKISQDHLDQELGRTASDDEVAPFWRTVIDANRERLHSGDPDLIYPGEVVHLPSGG